jgi:hypothetical protein
MAEKLREKIRTAGGAKNIEIIISSKPPEIDFDINLVLFSNVLHEMENPEEYLSWARKSDYVVVAEWKK